VTELSFSTRAAILIGLLGLSTGCLTGQGVGVSDPNDVAVSQSEVTPQNSPKGHDITLVSDTNWEVYSSRGKEQDAYIGKAQFVCFNSASSTDCPEGALDYGHGTQAWGAHIDACAGNARWIWAPGVTGASAPAEMAEFYFVNQVELQDRPASAHVQLAVDDQAEVIVNGKAVGAIGSTSDVDVAWANQNKPTSIDISSALVTGTNTIAIRAANGSGTFTNCTDCTYQQNPAGVVFCVDIRYSKE